MYLRSMAAVAAILVAFPATAEEVVLRGASAFGLQTNFSRDFVAFTDWVNENGKGEIQIEIMGGPEAVPTFELGNAVQTGVVDIANNTSAFYANLVPAGDALHLAQNTIQDQRANGCYEVVDRIHQEQMNVKFLARTGDNTPFHLYLTKPIDKPDLTGLTLRTTPVYRAMFEKLGATLVQTAPGEVYTALERGSIDGYGWPSQGILDLGWHEKTAYRVDPGFYQVDVNFLVNLDTWGKLTDAQKAILEQGAEWIEARNQLNIERNVSEFKAQADAGIETITFEGDDAAKWADTAQTEGWAKVTEIDAALSAELRSCMSK